MSQAISKIKTWRENPCLFVQDNFKVSLDRWQEKALLTLPDPNIQRVALSACAGPGKSALLAWTAWYFLCCYADDGEHPKAAAVSVTGDNLKDNLWPELSKWRERSQLISEAFEWTKERIFSKKFPATWFMSALLGWLICSNYEQT